MVQNKTTLNILLGDNTEILFGITGATEQKCDILSPCASKLALLPLLATVSVVLQ